MHIRDFDWATTERKLIADSFVVQLDFLNSCEKITREQCWASIMRLAEAMSEYEMRFCPGSASSHIGLHVIPDDYDEVLLLDEATNAPFYQRCCLPCGAMVREIPDYYDFVAMVGECQ